MKLKSIKTNKDIFIKSIYHYNNILILKDKIYKDIKNKTGIYIWTNNISGKKYVGSAINLKERLRRYFDPKFLVTMLLKNNSIIYRALLKYNYNNFELNIIEFCDSNILLQREQYYLDNFEFKYNILKFAGSRLNHKTSFETKKAISLALRNKNTLNKLYLKSNILNIKSKLYFRGWNNGIKVKIYDSSNKLLGEFIDMKSAAEYLGICKGTMYKIYKTNVSYDNYTYIFEKRIFKIGIYDIEHKLTKVLDSAKETSIIYKIPKSTLSDYIKSGKLFKNKYYFRYFNVN